MPRGGGKGEGGGGGQAWQDQPPEAIRRAMRVAGGWLARARLRRRRPAEVSDGCWTPSNRAALRSGDKGSDSLGHDVRVETARSDWLHEAKSARDEGGEFELGARGIAVAGGASPERERRHRIMVRSRSIQPAGACCRCPTRSLATCATASRSFGRDPSAIRFGPARRCRQHARPPPLATCAASAARRAACSTWRDDGCRRAIAGGRAGTLASRPGGVRQPDRRAWRAWIGRVICSIVLERGRSESSFRLQVIAARRLVDSLSLDAVALSMGERRPMA